VWFNVGVREARGYGWIYDQAADRVAKLTGATRPQCSACFIVSVKDSLESILDLAKTEGMLFKWGSGTGSNLSTLREEDAVLSGGGRASGQEPDREQGGENERGNARANGCLHLAHRFEGLVANCDPTLIDQTASSLVTRLTATARRLHGSERATSATSPAYGLEGRTW